jgi:hypothetical protein
LVPVLERKKGMSDLLSLAVSAHGGLDRWKTFQAIEARMAVGGGIFAAIRNPGLQNDVTYRIQTHQERVAIDRFPAPDRRVNFVPSRLTLETLSRDLIEARDDPRSDLLGKRRNRPGIRSMSPISPAMPYGPI